MNVGILGAGRIAVAMAQTLNGMEDACAYAVASRDIRRAEEFAEKNHVEKAYGSYAEMLMDDKVDLVYIATPHSHHLEHGKLCISYGKPVLCEKSFTANVKQAKELLAYAKEKNVFITEAIWTRYMPSRKLIADILSSGELGELKGLSANLGYDVVDKERMVKPELAGGALLDVGVYPLNFASMCFGNEIEKITSACVWSPTGVDAQDAMILTYKDGRLATLHAGMLAATEQYGIVYGTKGYMIAYNINNVDRIEILTENLSAQWKCQNRLPGTNMKSGHACGRWKPECWNVKRCPTVKRFR